MAPPYSPAPEATTHLDDDDLTPIGLWCRSLLQGTSPSEIPWPEVTEDGYLKDDTPWILTTLTSRDVDSASSWPLFATGALAFLLTSVLYGALRSRFLAGRIRTYDDLLEATSHHMDGSGAARRSVSVYAVIVASTFFSLVYLTWRFTYSLPLEHGWLAMAANLILLAVETIGFFETLIHYRSMARMRTHELPAIPDDAYPDVDIFIATYNEPCDLLRRTINGCTHLRYRANMRGAVVNLMRTRIGGATVHGIEILDYGTSELEYLQILYDRIPSLPQSINGDFGILRHLWRNIAYRAANTV